VATTHHPAPTHAGFGHHHEWMWIALGAVLIGLIAAGISWFVMQPESDTATQPANVTGFDYEEEATAGRLVTGTVTAPFVGESGDLHAVIAPIRGFEDIHEVTTFKAPPADPVTTQYFGNSGVMYPEVATAGLDIEHETTPIRLWDGTGVTVPFVGQSGELDADK
jgi:hypothetical protein